MSSEISFGSLCVHEVKDNRTTKPHQLPIYATSSFEFESIDQGIDVFSGKEKGHKYSRIGNPTVDTVGHKIALLETHNLDIDAKGFLASSGMSAISTAIFACVKAGDKILTQENLYGGTAELLTRILEPLNVEPLMTDLKDLNRVEDLLKQDKSISLIYCETPANPTMACIDLEAVGSLAKQYGVKTIADNTFCTPYIQQPLKYGFDFVVHSTTKFLNGHGNSISGAIVGRDVAFMEDRMLTAIGLIGTNCSPWEAWLVNNGLKTLEVRMERHSENAMAVASFLEQHPKVKQVNYNGLVSHPDHELAKKQMRTFGSMMSIELVGGLEAGKKFLDSIKLCTIAPTLGDVDTLIVHPASMSHINIPREIRIRNGITDGLVRISVGIENAKDLIADITQAID